MSVAWSTGALRANSEGTNVRPWVLVLLPRAHGNVGEGVASLIDAGDTEGARNLELSLFPATNVSRSAPVTGRGIGDCPPAEAPASFPQPETCKDVSMRYNCPTEGGRIGYWCQTMTGNPSITTYDGYCIDRRHSLSGTYRGEAVQVEPMKSKLNAPGAMRLKLKYDNVLSGFAFNLNLRRYTLGSCASTTPTTPRLSTSRVPTAAMATSTNLRTCPLSTGSTTRLHRGRAVQVDPMKPTLKAPGSKRFEIKYDQLLSNFAFKFNLRRYTEYDGVRPEWSSAVNRQGSCLTRKTRV